MNDMKTEHFTAKRLFAASALRNILIICLIAVTALSGCKKDQENSSQISTTTTTQTTSTQTADSDTTILNTDTTTVTAATGIPPYGWCNASTMHIRSGPGTEYGAIGGLKKGEKVTIVDREGDWFKIEFKDGFGYVSALYIQDTEVMPDETTMTAETTPATTVAQ
jgi:hypothetical protein